MGDQRGSVGTNTARFGEPRGWLRIDDAGYVLLPAWVAEQYPALPQVWATRALRKGSLGDGLDTVVSHPLGLISVRSSPKRVLLASPHQAAAIVAAQQTPRWRDYELPIWQPAQAWGREELLLWFLGQAMQSALEFSDLPAIETFMQRTGRSAALRRLKRELKVPYYLSRAPRTKYAVATTEHADGRTQFKGIDANEELKDD